MSERILVIDDDVDFLQIMANALGKSGYLVDVASGAVEGLQKAYHNQPNLIVLDIMLPDLDGWETCQRFREMSSVPIIMLSALGGEENIVKGLSLGADDYMVKPMMMEELRARVRALLRRSQTEGESLLDMDGIYEHAGVMVDIDRHIVTLNAQEINLSPTEFRLLSFFAQNQGRVLTCEELLAHVWGDEYVGELDHLRLYISYLRRKVEANPSKPKLIRNVWGVGYRFG